MRCLYGKQDMYKDVTDIVKEHFVKDNDIVIPQHTAFNDLFGDIIPGETKTLYIEIGDKKMLITEDDIMKHTYKIDGVSGQVGIASENKNIVDEMNFNIMNNNLINYLKHKNIYLIGPAESNFDISTIPDDENNVIVVINRFNDYNNYIKLKDYKNIILFHSFFRYKPVLQDFLYVISTYPLFGDIKIDQINKELLKSKCYFNDNNNNIFKHSIVGFKSNQLNSIFTSIDLQLYTELCELLDYEIPTSGMIVLYFFIKNINIINKLNIIGMSLGLTKYEDNYIKPHLFEVINSVHNINKEQLEFKKLYIKSKDKIFIENKKFNEYLNMDDALL